MKALLVGLLLLGNMITNNVNQKPKLADPQATLETQALFSNLKAISQRGILFGHQHATEYGRGWAGDEPIIVVASSPSLGTLQTQFTAVDFTRRKRANKIQSKNYSQAEATTTNSKQFSPISLIW
jgi:hypothetical protein